MSSPPVYFVGLRYPHHARHSGYERFAPLVGHVVSGPSSRWLPGRLGRAIDRGFAVATARPRYSLGAFGSELAGAVHLLRRGGAVYHLIYGDRDSWLFPHLHGVRGNRVVASFHLPPSLIRLRDYAWAGRNLDAAVLVAESQRAPFERLLPPDRVFVVPHGVDTTFFAPDEADEPAGNPICISVGSHLRDFETLHAAMPLVWAAEPRARFLLVGANQRPPLHDVRVLVAERLDDHALRRAYRESSVAILPFRDATASVSLLEALACGLPVVTTAVGGVPEYASGAAVLCSPQDARALAEAVVALLASSAERMRLRRAARARALEFDYEVVATRQRAVYDAVFDRAAR